MMRMPSGHHQRDSGQHGGEVGHHGVGPGPWDGDGTVLPQG